MIGAGEMIDYYIAFANYSLKRREQALAAGEHFLKTYPASMYYNPVKMYVEQARAEAAAEKEKRAAADAKVAELIAQADAAAGSERAILLYRIGSEYSSAAVYEEARAYFRRIKLSDLAQAGVAADLVLYLIFTCDYNLLDKDDAVKLLNTVKALYPASTYIQAMQQMLIMFPQ
jgi:tetratricopeptide (TPR) repeat protein